MDKAETLKAVAKADKFLQLMLKGSGWYTTKVVCKAAAKKRVDGVKNSMILPQMVVWLSLMLLCGGLTFIHFL